MGRDSREDDNESPVDVGSAAEASSAPPSNEPSPAPAIERAPRPASRLPMLVLAVMTFATLAFAFWAARSM